MPRAKGGPKTRQRRKKRLKQAKGYYGGKSRLFRTATEAVDKANIYAYRDRRQRKRDLEDSGLPGSMPPRSCKAFPTADSLLALKGQA